MAYDVGMINKTMINKTMINYRAIDIAAKTIQPDVTKGFVVNKALGRFFMVLSRDQQGTSSPHPAYSRMVFQGPCVPIWRHLRGLGWS
jgi:hypothetical protein